jgi:hypothetical protein
VVVGVVALAAAVAVPAGVAGRGGGPAVVVASVPLPASGEFALRYRHSSSEAVLDYYELEGRRTATGGWRRLEPAATPRLDALPLVATEVGRRTLEAGGRRLPLYTEGGDPARLVLSVRP